MTGQGSAYSQFKRALKRQNFMLASTMAAEPPKMALADSLSLLLLALDQQPWRFETAAPRWHARLCAEARLTLAEAQLAVAVLNALAGPGAVAGGHALVGICAPMVSMTRSGSSTPGWLAANEARRSPHGRAGSPALHGKQRLEPGPPRYRFQAKR